MEAGIKKKPNATVWEKCDSSEHDPIYGTRCAGCRIAGRCFLLIKRGKQIAACEG